MDKPHSEAAPEKGGRHYNSAMSPDELRAEAEAIVADHKRRAIETKAAEAAAISAARAYLDEHKAASTRDRLAHQALVEGRN